MRVTAVIRPPNETSGSAPRAFYAVDDFARALGEALAIEVPIIEGTLADAPPDGILLVFELRHDDDRRLGPRIVAFNEHRGEIMKRAEDFQLAAAVEANRYFEWRSNRTTERGYGLVGRKDMAPRMSARIVSGPFTSEHYGLLASDTAQNLVELLAAYLRTYAQQPAR